MAISAIRDNNFSVREASRQYGVPRFTMQNGLKVRISEHSVRKTGSSPIMTKEDENKLAKWLLEIKNVVSLSISRIILKRLLKLQKPQENFTCSKINDLIKSGIYYFFLKRHPDISLKEAESINKARALLTEETVRK